MKEKTAFYPTEGLIRSSLLTETPENTNYGLISNRFGLLPREQRVLRTHMEQRHNDPNYAILRRLWEDCNRK